MKTCPGKSGSGSGSSDERRGEREEAELTGREREATSFNRNE